MHQQFLVKTFTFTQILQHNRTKRPVLNKTLLDIYYLFSVLSNALLPILIILNLLLSFCNTVELNTDLQLWLGFQHTEASMLDSTKPRDFRTDRN
jgi:hypothetical protein